MNKSDQRILYLLNTQSKTSAYQKRNFKAVEYLPKCANRNLMRLLYGQHYKKKIAASRVAYKKMNPQLTSHNQPKQLPQVPQFTQLKNVIRIPAPGKQTSKSGVTRKQPGKL